MDRRKIKIRDHNGELIEVNLNPKNLKTVVKGLKVIRLYSKLHHIRRQKALCVKKQKYEKASRLRDAEREEIERLNRIS